MAYADFTLDELTTKLGVTTVLGVLFPDVPAVPSPSWLSELLARNNSLVFLTEKSRSEFVVAPVLRAVEELCPVPLALYSGYRLDIDRDRGLVGECDFLISIAQPVLPLRPPVVTLVEAKKADIELGLAQCVAQMVGAAVFNARAGQPDRRVYGCVTTGEVWQFLRLDGSTVTHDARRYFLGELGLLLGVFARLLAEYLL